MNHFNEITNLNKLMYQDVSISKEWIIWCIIIEYSKITLLRATIEGYNLLECSCIIIRKPFQLMVFFICLCDIKCEE